MANKKQLKYGDEAREKIKAGVDKLANAVKVTLGPKGQYVIIDRPLDNSIPIVTNDGVTIAREINLSDPFENMGAQIVKEVASKTNDNAGDGTTSAIVLVQKIVEEGFKNIAAGTKAAEIVKEIKEAADVVIRLIKDLSQPIESDEEIKQIATISAGSDEIGQLIADAMKSVGRDGIITIDESRGSKTELKIEEGLQFDRGLLTPYFVTNIERGVAEYTDALIVLIDDSVVDVQQFLPVLEQLAAKQKPFLLVATECSGTALFALVQNKLKQVLKCAVVNAPGYGDKRKEIMEDIAIMTGATVISKEKGINLGDVTDDMFGRASRIVCTKDNTTLVVESSDKEKVEQRTNQVREQIENVTNNYDKEYLRKRLARLVGGVAVIYVGAPTEADLRAKKFKVEDALNATKSAVEMGIVPGGGYALATEAHGLNSNIGARIIETACKEPMRMIAENAGETGDMVVKEVLKIGKGYDADKGEYCDLIASGIIDPTKVCIQALENAVSSASLLLNTRTLITNEVKDA